MCIWCCIGTTQLLRETFVLTATQCAKHTHNALMSDAHTHNAPNNFNAYFSHNIFYFYFIFLFISSISEHKVCFFFFGCVALWISVNTKMREKKEAIIVNCFRFDVFTIFFRLLLLFFSSFVCFQFSVWDFATVFHSSHLSIVCTFAVQISHAYSFMHSFIVSLAYKVCKVRNKFIFFSSFSDSRANGQCLHTKDYFLRSHRCFHAWPLSHCSK